MIWHADAALARRVEHAEALNGARCAAVQPGSAVGEFGGGRAVFVGVGSPLTHAVGIGLSGPVSGREMERLEDFFASRGSPPVIDLCPLAHPSLHEHIAGGGYHAAEFNNQMVRATGETVPYASVEVREARGDEERLWSRVLAQGFLDREDITEEERHVGEVLFRIDGAVCYFAFLHGEAVAGAALAMEGGVGLLFADSTRVAWRGRGAHLALLAARRDRQRRCALDRHAAGLAGCGHDHAARA